MNDVYVGLFIVAATVFARSDRLVRGRAVLIAMPVIGVLLGSRSRAVGRGLRRALLLLILVRSALGRVLAIPGSPG
jgi:hypothetical protein